jgi:cell wall-associated NlpC family hydrolase
MRKHPGMSILCVVLLAFFSLATLSPTTVEARSKKRTYSKVSYKKKKSRRNRRSKCTVAARAEGKRQAMELVRTQSTELCRLVGIEPSADTNALATAQSLIKNDGEEEATTEAHPIQYDEGEDIAELEQEDDVTVDVDAFRSLWLRYVDEDEAQADLTDAGIEKQKFIDVVMDWLGTRYDFGGTVRSGIDCSAFTRQVYATVASIELPRTAALQNGIGSSVRRADLRFGDLVFFHTRRHARVSHVGIYLGDNLFAHSSSRYGVTISSLESTYYSKRLLGGRRITAPDMARLATTVESTSAN